MEFSQRKPTRLNRYDYSRNGAYFITVCTVNRIEFLWDWNVGADIIRPPLSSTYQLSEYGKIVDASIVSIPYHYHNVSVDKYVIMPNHIHMILMLSQDNGRILSAPTKGISTIVGQMKRVVSQRIGFSLWQKSFHDHIIRNEPEYCKIWEYIDTNPIQWESDCFYGSNRQG